ncbi:DUF4276 family protein [Bacteroides uniformis]|nr:DUF4276 family protein [Bacteroides uniformis]
MKAKIIHVLCEGQTEQGFVEEVLRPYLQAQGVAGVKSILITTNKKKECPWWNAELCSGGDRPRTVAENEDGRRIRTSCFHNDVRPLRIAG